MRPWWYLIHLCVSISAVILLVCASADCQVARRSKSSPKAESLPRPDLARWQYMLDDLALEARTITQEEKRPLLMAEVAHAYWDLDSTRARELFTSALEALLLMKPGTKESSQALRHVIRLAAKRNPALSRELTDKMLKSAEKDWINTESFSVALDLLDADPKVAAHLAEAMAGAGPTLDSAWFLLQLSKRDPATADRIYLIYLTKLAANNMIGPDRLLWMAGYPFGYAEGFGGTDPNQMAGFHGLRVAGLRSNPALAVAFLNVAFGSVQNALQQASSSNPAQAETLNGLALFATSYLLPEVQRYSPRTSQRWSVLHHQALSSTTVRQKEAVAEQIKRIVDSRIRTDQQEAMEFNARDQGEDLLESVDKLASGCKRDVEYAKIALRVGHAKNPLRALEIASKIDNDSMRDGVRQFIYYDMSAASIADDWPVNLVEAERYAERVTSLEQRALLYVKIARAALKNKDRFAAAELLRKTIRLAQAISDPTSQASVLLAAAARFAEFDVYEAYRAIKEAVRSVNRARSETVDDFRVLRKVSLGCAGGVDAWYGDSQRAERFSLFETFATIGTRDVDGMLYIARELEDPSIRIRSLIAIIRAMIEKTIAAAHVTEPTRP